MSQHVSPHQARDRAFGACVDGGAEVGQLGCAVHQQHVLWLQVAVQDPLDASWSAWV